VKVLLRTRAKTKKRTGVQKKVNKKNFENFLFSLFFLSSVCFAIIIIIIVDEISSYF